MSRGISTTILPEASPQASVSERDLPPADRSCGVTLRRAWVEGGQLFEATFANSTTVAVIIAFPTDFNVDFW